MGEDHYPITGSDAICSELADNSPRHLLKEQHSEEQFEVACTTPLQTMAPGPVATTLSPAAKRKAASEFVQATTGVFVPFSSDQSFRGALKDGVLLCRMVNTLWPGINAQCLEATDVEQSPHGVQQQMAHNLAEFFSAVEQQLQGLPLDCRFSVADVGSVEHAEERPQVANCILYIRAACSAQYPQQQQMLPVANLQFEQMPMTPPAPRSAGNSSSGAMHMQQQYTQQQYISPQPPQPVHMALAPGAMSPGLPVSSYMTPTQAGPSMHPALVSPQPPGSYGYHQPGSGMQQHHMQRASPWHGDGVPPGALVASSPLMAAHSSLSHGGAHGHQHAHSGSLVAVRSSSNMYSNSISAATHKSVQAAAGVTKLMQQCTNMLKERMFPGEQAGGSRYGSPAGPDSAMKALGPVLEGVLGHLTEEYEKRLLLKDHQLSAISEAKAKAEKEVERLQEEVAQLRDAADSQQAEVERAAAGAAEAKVQQLQEQLEQAHAALQAKEAELVSAHTMLDSAGRKEHEELLRLQVDTLRMREELDGLRDLEDRYKRVVEENRTLYNTVQDLRGNIRVFCRIRPAGATGDMSPNCVDVGMDGDMAIYDAQHGSRRVFKVDRIFDQHMSQQQVYEDTQPLIRSVLDGYNVCIFAYGQTGSGKTHTMSGTDTIHTEGRGINYRALDDLFSIRDGREDEYEYTFRVQMLEIYNENLRDLLADGRSHASARLDILATQASGCNVPGATQVDVCGADDVAALMSKGASQRATSETKMNDRSSRSHQILTVIVDGVHKLTRARSHGCLHLIDLAGSERVSKSEASGDRLVEAQHINKSLSALGDVMAALASKDRHIPYRNSKLTQLLQDSLQGQAKVMMFMHVSPEANMHGESVSTLKFAARVSEITLGQAKKNVVSGKVFEAHEEVLKHQRTMESKEQQLQQLQAALHQRDQQHARELLQRDQENEQLRRLLEEARSGAGGSPATVHAPAAAAAAAKQRTRLQLPIQQMLAQQAAEAEAFAKAEREAAAAAAAEEAADAGESAAARSREASSSGAAREVSSGGVADEPSSTAVFAQEEEGTDSPAAAAGAGLSRVDKSPLRDQDECTPLPSSRFMQAESSSHFGYDYSSSVEPTPRATPRATPRSGRKEQVSRLTSAASSSSARVSASHGGIPSSRSSARADAAMPMTVRTSGVIKSRVTEVGSSTMSMRQSGVFSRSGSSTAAAAAAAGATTARGGSTASGAATSRGGSRWK
ncbi:hypothetical protein OEZ85_012873 [Tetradesmus obliquus]|uniref:Kinesin motor domain-containing protein n=1 Tax=Tetradesmus obliquus TaxID=3088 RepID=A0ABY8U941_TETOB|nr:hypothetical protein OEZ85_012873 [Tetradesmus obliquus]